MRTKVVLLAILGSMAMLLPAQGFKCGGTAHNPLAAFRVGVPSPLAPKWRTMRGPAARPGVTLAGTLDDVKDVVAEQLGVDRAKIESHSNFIKDLDADSLDSVELVMAFEEKFGVEIPDDEAAKITTVQEAVDFVDKAKA